MQLFDENGSPIEIDFEVTNGGFKRAHVKKLKGVKQVFGICPLCQQYERIIYSHINPNWAWKTRKTFVEDGSIAQNGEAFYLLCGSCDSSTSTYENSLRDASSRQITEFSVTIETANISMGLLAIFWRAHLANTICRDSPPVWNNETAEWARQLLLSAKILKNERHSEPESVANEQMYLSGIKFFSKDVERDNPQASQGLPTLLSGTPDLGATFVGGILWTLHRGNDKSRIKIHPWTENIRLGDFTSLYPYKESNTQSQILALESIVRETADNSVCPCGWYSTTKAAGEVSSLTFASCCKKGWLRLPLTESYAEAEPTIFRINDKELELKGSMQWRITVTSDKSDREIIEDQIKAMKLKPGLHILTVERHEVRGNNEPQ